MSARSGRVIKILEREYRVRTDADREHLEAVAAYVDGVLREVRRSTPDTQDASVLAALNIASELLRQKRHGRGASRAHPGADRPGRLGLSEAARRAEGRAARRGPAHAGGHASGCARLRRRRLSGLPELESCAHAWPCTRPSATRSRSRPVAGSLSRAGACVVYPVVVGAELELAPDPARAGASAGERGRPVRRAGVALRPARAAARARGGHYDRLLARRRADAWLVGICYDDRVADELPEDPWDVRMHVVVAARFVLRVAAP